MATALLCVFLLFAFSFVYRFILTFIIFLMIIFLFNKMVSRLVRLYNCGVEKLVFQLPFVSYIILKSMSVVHQRVGIVTLASKITRLKSQPIAIQEHESAAKPYNEGNFMLSFYLPNSSSARFSLVALCSFRLAICLIKFNFFLDFKKFKRKKNKNRNSKSWRTFISFNMPWML